MSKFKVGDKARHTERGFKAHVVGITSGGAVRFIIDENPNKEWTDIRHWANGKPCWVSPRSYLDKWELIKAGRPRKEKPIQYIVIYDETCGDPHKLFKTRKEVKDWIKEALDDENIINSSIKAYKLDHELVVGHQVTLRKKRNK